MRPIKALFQREVSDRDLESGANALLRLGGWWLTGAALERLARTPVREADPRQGEFIVLLARTAPSAVIPDGLALPLRWEKQRRHDRRLPAKIRELAEQIRLASTERSRCEYRLQLGDDCPDLSWCEVGAESAGAMLAATLEIARLGAKPDPFVTASAEWKDAESLRTVDGLEAKCAAAARLGLRALWVAPTQDLGALDMSAIKVAIKVAQLPESSGSDQLNALIGELDARPNASSLDAACAWYHRNRSRRGAREREARDFFCSELAPLLASEARRRDRMQDVPNEVDTLVVVATGQPSAAFIAAFLGPKQVFVAYIDDETGDSYFGDTAEAVRLAIGDVEVLPMPLPVPPAGDFLFLHGESLMRLRVANERACTAIDLTGGTTMLKLALSEAAQQLGIRRTLVNGSETSHAKGGPDVTTLRVVSIPHRAI
jgi:hypothetical protein